MPAEWERHDATWLSWPHNPETWPGRLDRAQRAYAEMVRAVAEVETVHLNVGDAETERSALRLLRRAGVRGDVRLHCIPTDDAWVRDHGPTFVRTRHGAADSAERGDRVEAGCAAAGGPLWPGGGTSSDRLTIASLVAVDWVFNCWGEKYPPYDADAVAGARMAEAAGVARLAPPLVLEGGAIDVDGSGRVLLTESSVLNPNRNPGLSRGAIEAALRRLLGVDRFLWLPGGIAGDDTDGHIDDVARFVGAGRIVAAVESDPGDANHRTLQENRAALQRYAADEGLDVVALPMPPPIVVDGQRLPASYANFYVCNERVIVPTFGVATDAEALAILREQFPRREVVGIEATDVVLGLGAWHCLTQQVPCATGAGRETDVCS
ncbi:MAG: agmatine deiminase family protein [Planctomycetota bacterium]|nr:MAG: agmatine deiminase family protein [Planctomycetota bacterium]